MQGAGNPSAQADSSSEASRAGAAPLTEQHNHHSEPDRDSEPDHDNEPDHDEPGSESSDDQ